MGKGSGKGYVVRRVEKQKLSDDELLMGSLERRNFALRLRVAAPKGRMHERLWNP